MYKEILNNKIAESMKAGDKISLGVWRAIKSEFINYEKSDTHAILNDAVEMKIITKMVAQRKDAANQYRNAGRVDLAENEESEMAVLSDLLPKEASDSEIAESVKEAIEDIKKQFGADYTVSMRNMKDVQAAVRKKYSTADGGKIANLFKEFIN